MNTQFFIIGSRYRNRLGWYEVLNIEEKRIFVRYDNGNEDWLDKKTAARIAENMDREDSAKIPSGITSGHESNFSWTLGIIASKGVLAAEVPPQSRSGFWADYTRCTGVIMQDNISGIHVISEGGENKWGCELRIYIPSSATENERFRLPDGVNIASGNTTDNMRINNNAFWWHLVRRLNFRAGSTQDLQLIESSLPGSIRPDFRQGCL